MRAGIVLGLACAVLGCTATRPSPRTSPAVRPLPYVSLLEAASSGSEEDRYAAILALRQHDSPRVKARLVALARDEAPLIRNAASRALAELEPGGAAGLIANLFREERTYVVTDAIFHLRQLFPAGPAYEPNLGYRHQTEQQHAWRAWYARHGRGTLAAATEPAGEVALREQVETQLAAFEAASYPDPEAEDAAIVALWQSLAELAPSRHPHDVRLVADAFELLTVRRPHSADLWNNFGLSALNDSRWEQAEQAYARALAITPEDAALHNDLGILLEGLGRHAEAEAAYRRATELAPEDDIAWANLGDVLRRQGRHAEARDAYGAAERLAPEKWYYHRLWLGRMPSTRVRCRDGR